MNGGGWVGRKEIKTTKDNEWTAFVLCQQKYCILVFKIAIPETDITVSKNKW